LSSKTQSSRTARSAGVQTIQTLDFDDNRLLAKLVGAHDKNLVEIEQRLNVQVARRGNHITITGDTGASDVAAQVLRALYDRLETGAELAPGDIVGEIRLLSSGRSGSAHEIRTRRANIRPRTVGQAGYVEALLSHDLVFGLGPAGTGKTYLAVAVAVSKMLQGKVKRIILSRPAVEAGEKLGFLPGDLKEKVDPYLRPLYDALFDMLPPEQVQRWIDTGEIEIAPLAFMRGRTLSHAYVILDEAQNTTTMQMKMFLTRLGEGSHMAVTGDASQTDLPGGQQSGLAEARRILADVEGVAFIELTSADVVRHDLVARIVDAYDRSEGKNGARALRRNPK
jgi:phosphate starvation-inducible PhoH-like protein